MRDGDGNMKTDRNKAMAGGTDMEKALLDPGAVFAGPEDVVAEASPTAERKVEILRRRAHGAAKLAVADEEGTGNGEAVSSTACCARSISWRRSPRNIPGRRNITGCAARR